MPFEPKLAPRKLHKTNHLIKLEKVSTFTTSTTSILESIQVSTYSLFLYTLFLLIFLQLATPLNAINIQASNFDRFILPCYNVYTSENKGTIGYSESTSFAQQQQQQYQDKNYRNQEQASRNQLDGQQQNDRPNYLANSIAATQQSPRLSSSLIQASNNDRIASTMFAGSVGTYLGQQIPRAQSIDNFISIVSKIEASYPRIANNLPQFIRILLSRFHYDNFYYDKYTRTHVDLDMKDRKRDRILNTLFNSVGVQQEYLPENILDLNEKCSMYFMLSHFVETTTPYKVPLVAQPFTPLVSSQDGGRPPYLKAAGSQYPSTSANSAYSSSLSGSNNGQNRKIGSVSFGSPEISSSYGFGTGISNTADNYGNNMYGTNTIRNNNPYVNQNLMRDGRQLSQASFSQPYTPIVNAMTGTNRDIRAAYEFGVVTVGYQDNAAVALNRVLLGILAAFTNRQPLRDVMISTDNIDPSSAALFGSKFNEREIDPVFAATLADLWTSYAKPTSDKLFDSNSLIINGNWNDTICPTNFKLHRPPSTITTSEILGGLDGFNLGLMLRQSQGRRQYKLSELLKSYYSKDGMKPLYPEIGVCSRATNVNTQLDELRQQAENYYKLMDSNLPTQDGEIFDKIRRADAFKDSLRQIASQFTPQSVCFEQDSSNFNNQCEIPKSDVVVIMDTSSQADQMFMSLLSVKLSRKIGISRTGSRLTLLTNQQDSNSRGNFNTILKNSTNNAEIGCALVHDDTRMLQGGQITDPIRLMQMFEQTFINLDDYPYRQNSYGQQYQSSSSSQQPLRLFISSLSEYPSSSYSTWSQNTGNSKAVIFFNYGSQLRPNSMVSFQQQNVNYPVSSSSSSSWGFGSSSDDADYKLIEAKRNFKENFVGAAVLAIGTNKDEIRKIVFNEDRDIFIVSSSASGGSGSFDSLNPSWASNSELNGQVDVMTDKLLARICQLPAEFEYPGCYQMPSSNVMSVGYISQGKTQNWIMAPKTFFSSRTIRMSFRVEGGKLRVCFGRTPNPEDGFSKSYPGQPALMPSTKEAYDSENGVCKDLVSGQEVEFVVEDPCWRFSSVASCPPFYFTIKETSSLGELDPNWVCRDEECKRTDQVKFTLTHTGVACSSALNSLNISLVALVASMLFGLWSSTATTTKLRTSLITANNQQQIRCGRSVYGHSKMFIIASSVVCCLITLLSSQVVEAQQAGVYDFGQNRYGEKRGNLTPSEWLAIVLLVMVILGGFAFTLCLCYYVSKKDRNGMTPVRQDDDY